MPDLILDLRRERHLAHQRRGPGETLALRERPHYLGVGVHLDELEHSTPIVVRHPIGGLDLPTGLHVLGESSQSALVGYDPSSPRPSMSANPVPTSRGVISPPSRSHA